MTRNGEYCAYLWLVFYVRNTVWETTRYMLMGSPKANLLYLQAKAIQPVEQRDGHQKSPAFTSFLKAAVCRIENNSNRVFVRFKGQY